MELFQSSVFRKGAWPLYSNQRCNFKCNTHLRVLILSGSCNWFPPKYFQLPHPTLHCRLFPKLKVQIWALEIPSLTIVALRESGAEVGSGGMGGGWKILITAFRMFILFCLKTKVHPLCYIWWLNPTIKVHLNHKSWAIQSHFIKMRLKIRESSRWVGGMTTCFPEISFSFFSDIFSEKNIKPVSQPQAFRLRSPHRFEHT
jgi:hypothetical protein